MRIVTVLGKEKAIELFCDTQEIESKGGMLIMVIFLITFFYSIRIINTF